MEDYSAVPQELKDLKQWVCVAIRPAKPNKTGKVSKPRKVPMRDAEHEASVSDPSSWLTFDNAVATMRAHPDVLKHIGFVFTAGDGYLGIDMDNVVGSDGHILDEARAVVDRFQSYTEYSVSGKGLHIIVKGEKPGKSCRKKWLEMYDHGRYFIFSGRTLPDSEPDVQERQAELDEFYEEWWPPEHDPKDELDGPKIEVPADYDTKRTIEMVCQDEKTALLFAGEFSKYDSQSSADMALCVRLQKVLNDLDRVDAVFRASGLMRPKWDENRGGETYGQRTLKAAGNAVKSAEQNPTTHEDFANNILRELQSGGVAPIRRGDTLYQYVNGIWEQKAKEDIINEIAKKFNKQLKKQQEYSAVTKRAIEKLSAFAGDFDKAGFAFQNNICKVVSGQITMNKLVPADYARHSADFEPADTPCPAFDRFIAECFKGGENQIPLIQELIGLTLTGGLPDLQKCVVLYGPGASGKSVLIALIESMFPPALRASVPPNNWANEYYLDALLAAKLNTASELPSKKRVESETFKKVIAGDMVQARRIYGQTYQGRVTASHWFSCNALPTSDDVSTGWYRRFVIIDMPNTVPEDRRDPHLLASLVAERPGIAMWALRGVARFGLQGSLTQPAAKSGQGTISDVLIREWKDDQDSLPRWAAQTDLKQFVTWEEANASYRHYCMIGGENPQSARSVRKLWEEAKKG